MMPAPIVNAPAPRRFAAFLIATMALLSAPGAGRAETSAVKDGNVVVLQNEQVRVVYDLASGTYSACSRTNKSSNITGACLRIDEFTSDAAGLTRTWESAPVKDELGTGRKLTAKVASAARVGADDLEASVMNWDAVGKRVDPGVSYLPDDRCYVDFCTANPFDALEQYGLAVRAAQKVKLTIHNFPTVCGWYVAVFGGGGGSEPNNSAGMVAQMDAVAKSGFLRYGKVAVRVVPDDYGANNEQGWWDDEHWQKYGHYVKPYETTKKWAQAVIERGGVPLTYSQTGCNSRDFIAAHPDWYLFNDTRRLFDDKGGLTYIKGALDYTDPGFKAHLRKVYENMRDGGLAGLMFDYPENLFRQDGGFEDKYATAAAAYRTIFDLPKTILGPESSMKQTHHASGAKMLLLLSLSLHVVGCKSARAPASDAGTLRPTPDSAVRTIPEDKPEVVDPKLGATEGNWVWYDGQRLKVEGRGWTNTAGPYHRLPAGATVPGSAISHHTAGVAIYFITDATDVQVRWTVSDGGDLLGYDHMPTTGVSGVDCYERNEAGKWRFVGNGGSGGWTKQSNCKTFTVNAGRENVVYLPLYNGVKSIEIGVPKDKTVSLPRQTHVTNIKPIVFYGTSITQGACADRPGMSATAIVGRELDVPVINLGFSGCGNMDPGMANLLAELDPSVYVIDCLWNMDPGLVAARTEPLVRKLREKHPNTPVVLVEDSNFNDLPTEKGRILREICEKLTKQGDENLHFLSNKGMLGNDGEGTVEGCHLNSLGMMRQATVFVKTLRPLLPHSTR